MEINVVGILKVLLESAILRRKPLEVPPLFRIQKLQITIDGFTSVSGEKAIAPRLLHISEVQRIRDDDNCSNTDT